MYPSLPVAGSEPTDPSATIPSPVVGRKSCSAALKKRRRKKAYPENVHFFLSFYRHIKLTFLSTFYVFGYCFEQIHQVLKERNENDSYLESCQLFKIFRRRLCVGVGVWRWRIQKLCAASGYQSHLAAPWNTGSANSDVGIF